LHLHEAEIHLVFRTPLLRWLVAIVGVQADKGSNPLAEPVPPYRAGDQREVTSFSGKSPPKKNLQRGNEPLCSNSQSVEPRDHYNGVLAMLSMPRAIFFASIVAALSDFALCQRRAVEDPFGPVESVVTGQENPAFVGKPDRQFKSIIESDTDSIELDLGTVRTSSDYLISIALANKSGRPRRFNKVASSCGCFSGLPKRVLFENGEPLELRVKFRSPRTGERFEEVIRLIDSDAGSQLRIEMKGVAKEAVRLGRRVFSGEGSGMATYETQIYFSPGEFDPEYFSYRVSDPRVTGWLVSDISDDKQSGVLTLNIVRGENILNNRAIVRVRDTRSNKPIGELFLDIRGKSEPLTRPSRLFLRKGGAELSGKIAVQLEGFTESQVRGEESVIKAKAIPKAASGTESFSFDLKAVLYSTTDEVTLALVTTSDPRLMNEDVANFDFEVTFEGESDKLTVPIVLVGGK
jgi:hypothetical protein